MLERWAIVTVVALVVACGEPGPPFTGTVSRSQHFEYHDQVDEPLCPTLLSLLDQHADQIGSKLGLSLAPDDPPFRYYKFRDVDAIRASGVCPADVDACAAEDNVFSVQYFHGHEQAHDYVYRAWGQRSVGLLDEGEAVALTCEPLRYAQPADLPATLVGNVDWRDILGLTSTTPRVHDGYHAAGYFVTYLVERFGWDNLKTLHRRVPRGASAPAFEAAFASIFPLTMDEAWAAALGTAGAAPCFKDWLCAATPFSVGDTASPSCDSAIHRSFTVEGQSGVGLALHGGNGEVTLLGGCTGPTPSWAELRGGLGGGATHWVFLPPGTYTFAELQTTGDPPAVSFLGFMPDNLPASACESAAALPLGPDGAFFDLRQGSVNGWVGVAGGGRTFRVYSQDVWVDPGGVVEICDGCAPGAACVPVPTDGSDVTVRLGDQAVVHMVDAYAIQAMIGPANPGPYILISSVAAP